MGCLTQVSNCLSSTFEQLGLYEPQIDLEEAKNRLNIEKQNWEKFLPEGPTRGRAFECLGKEITPLPSFIERAALHLHKTHEIERGVAVDLGCGVNPVSFTLLEQGWKVYAIDYSDETIQILQKKVSEMGKNWIENGQLTLVHKSIETFEYPEKVHLILAAESLPYCNPEKLQSILLTAKNALLLRGMFVGNLFPYTDIPLADQMLRAIGGWLTTKNVVEAVVRSADFSSWTVVNGKSRGGIAKQIQIFAENGKHDPTEFKEMCQDSKSFLESIMSEDPRQAYMRRLMV